LPPIFVGRSNEYNRATAEASRKLADEQVFDPERRAFDEFVNKTLMADMGVIYHDFVSLGANVTDDKDMIEIMKAAERSGGMVPEMAWKMVGDILGRQVPYPAQGIRPDVPFTIQLAEAVKNQAPVTAGSQVTAMKGKEEVVDLADWLNELLQLRASLDHEMFRRGINPNIDWPELEESTGEQ